MVFVEEHPLWRISTFHFIENAPKQSWRPHIAVPSLRKLNVISGSRYSISSGDATIASSVPVRLAHRLALPSGTPTRKARARSAMSPRRLLAASALVGLFAFAAAWLTAGRGGLVNLFWAVGVPVLTARAIDPRKDAWVTTSVWLVMFSFAVIVATARWR